MNDDQYLKALEKAKDEVRQIDVRLDEYKALIDRKKALKAFIKAGDRMTQPSGTKGQDQAKPQPTVDVTVRDVGDAHAVRIRVPLWQAILHSVKGEPMPISAKGAHAALVRDGRAVNGRNPVETVRGAMLNAKAVFEKTENGKFKLRLVNGTKGLWTDTGVPGQGMITN